MKLTVFWIAVVAFISWFQSTYSANCNSISTSSSCNSVAGCYWSDSRCTCASNVTMDVIFDIDASGSIGASSFQVALEWIVEIIDSGLTRGARVGFIRFATQSEILLDLKQSEPMTQTQLEQFAANIAYTGGYTNTVAALEQTMQVYSAQGNPYASWVHILMTDGNPYIPGGDTDVCSRASRMKAMGITTIIIGVGSQWNPANVDCLVTSDDDIIYVTSYTSGQLNTILPTLTAVTCPVSYNLIISEVQLGLASGKGSRFVEAYNPSTNVTLKDLDLDGIFEGQVTTDSNLKLPQGRYLVIYDKNAPNMISCQDCLCTKSNNLCVDAVYVGCCSSGCSCTFGGSSMDNTNWHVSFDDLNNGQNVDSVTYDTSTWPRILDGYTYALKYIGYDNQLGTNWEQSCNTRGTPGSYPIHNCSWTCTDQQCQLNGASSATCTGTSNNPQCNCNSNSYYFADRTCYAVPPPGDCEARWVKNETTGARSVIFQWEEAKTDRDHRYFLTYYARSGSQDSVITSSRTKDIADYDYSRGTSAVAGYVQTQILGADGKYAYSSSVSCYPVTQTPTVSPTFEPPYVYVSGDICSEERCSCSGQDPYNCTGSDVVKDFTANNNKTQYISIRREPQGFDSLVTVHWTIIDTLDYTGNSSSTSNANVPSRKLLFSTTEAPTNQSKGIHPVNGTLTFNETDLDQKIGVIIYKEEITEAESKYRWYLLNLTICHSSNKQVCTPVYPRYLRMRIDVTGGGEPFTEVKNQKQMPTWLWWLIGALVVFAIILALLGYRYWWKNKQTNQELLETEDQLEHALEENELGFGKDLGVGDVQFNPMATGVPGQKKAPDLFAGELEKRGNDANNVRADVAVEKFAHREQFGQQQGLKRGNAGGNDLSQPLLG